MNLVDIEYQSLDMKRWEKVSINSKMAECLEWRQVPSEARDRQDMGLRISTSRAWVEIV